MGTERHILVTGEVSLVRIFQGNPFGVGTLSVVGTTRGGERSSEKLSNEENIYWYLDEGDQQNGQTKGYLHGYQ